MFDSPDDDEYDGDFGEDDDEDPMINVFLKVEEAIIRTTARRERSASPDKEKNYRLMGTGKKPVVVNADEEELIAQYFEEMR